MLQSANPIIDSFLKRGFSLKSSSDLIDSYILALDIFESAASRTDDAGREKIARAIIRLGQQFESQLFQNMIRDFA